MVAIGVASTESQEKRMTTDRSRTIRIRTVALLGGGVAAGVIGATALGANAQTSGAAVTATSSTTSSPTHSTNGTSTETPVTGTKAATLKANALKKVPGATVDSVTTEDPSDSSGAAYEVHITKADGSHATLLFSSKLTYLSTETGGGHRGHGRGGANETAVTGTKAATLRAAALKQVPGATIDEVSTDSGDAAYEVHLTKSDGTTVTVKFDKSLKFVAVENGRGK